MLEHHKVYKKANSSRLAQTYYILLLKAHHDDADKKPG